MISLLMLLAQQVSMPPAEPHSVLIVILDDVAAVDLQGLSLPSLESLAAQGVSFTRAYANATCAPTRRSLQTGAWWVTGNSLTCEPPTPTTPALSEVFLPEAMPGYSSALLGKWHLGPNVTGGPWECAPLTQGYGYWAEGLASNVGLNGCGVDGFDYTYWARVDSGPLACAESTSTVYHPLLVAERHVTSWGASASPRLGVVSINLAHSPFHRPPAYLLPPGYPPTTTNRQLFEAMIVAYDSLIGYMLSAVDLEETLVVVFGDNGTPPPVAGQDHNRAKGTVFERGVRVPLIMAGAGIVSPGRSFDGLVHVVDIFSTCVEVAGGSQASVGISLVPALENVTQATHEYVLVGSRWGDTGGDIASVSSDGYKLRQLDDDGDEVVDREELYALPDEVANLIGDPAQTDRITAHRAFLASAIP